MKKITIVLEVQPSTQHEAQWAIDRTNVAAFAIARELNDRMPTSMNVVEPTTTYAGETISYDLTSKEEVIGAIQYLTASMKDITPENARRYYRDMKYRVGLEKILLSILEEESKLPDPRYGSIEIETTPVKSVSRPAPEWLRGKGFPMVDMTRPPKTVTAKVGSKEELAKDLEKFDATTRLIEKAIEEDRKKRPPAVVLVGDLVRCSEHPDEICHIIELGLKTDCTQCR